ncbi:MMPL family transporter [Parafrankia sp. EUN1f]|uniref:MMPL family transporter n=1 Tax=Parafrankia sp. EUN1f TaxID=102897 RepID=UPI0001C45A1E|nr:MMPL family transporter [Parafrankia sp. EUN1f]EFC83964.1 MMPL domain protein [Parafrankia sp. EUN1f]
MSGLLYRIGAAAATRPWRVIGMWLATLVVALGLAAGSGGEPHDDFSAPMTASQHGTDLLRANFPNLAGADARVVVHDPDGAPLDAGLLTTVRTRLAALPSAVVASPPQLSRDGDTALLTVNYTDPVADMDAEQALADLFTAATPATQRGLQVDVGGQISENLQKVDGRAEATGVVLALLILLIAFGSLVAAGVPIAVAMIGLGIGASCITLIAAVTTVSSIAPSLASMVGIGVGIDYALLLVTRHVEGLRAGLPVREAAGRANATAGASVVFAGLTVILSLTGLRLVGLSTYVTTAFTTAAVVIAVVLVAITLVPALCGLADLRVLRRRNHAELLAARSVARSVAAAGSGASSPGALLGSGEPSVAARRTLTAVWARRIGNRPGPWAFGALIILLALSAPILTMRTWPQDAGSQPVDVTQRRAYDLISSEYGPGANGPLLLAVDLRRIPPEALAELGSKVAAVPGVASVTPAVVAPSGTAAVIEVVPTTGPSDAASTELVNRLRDDVLPPGVDVTGTTAIFADLSALLAERLWWVVGFVVGVSILLLTIVFRSPVVALKAAVMNLLSISAAYGVVTAVFQWGWGTDLLGLPHSVPMSSWLPVLMFTVLFGLSMDYEVFLLSRIREDWVVTRDPRGSVVRGLASTARVITSAALIMIAVFAGFALDPDVTVKMVGVGMAVAVFVDATLIRLVLVPATMALLGRANWWLPRWCDRLLPQVDVHGERFAPGPAAAAVAPTDRAGDGRTAGHATVGKAGADRKGGTGTDASAGTGRKAGAGGGEPTGRGSLGTGGGPAPDPPPADGGGPDSGTSPKSGGTDRLKPPSGPAMAGSGIPTQVSTEPIDHSANGRELHR